MLLSIGDQVRPGTYWLHSCFARALNFRRAGRLVSVVDETIGPGPLNIVLRSLPAQVWEQAFPARSADFQSAVSRISNPQRLVRPPSSSRLKTCGTADWKAALRSRQPGGRAPTIPARRVVLQVGRTSVRLADQYYRFTSRQRYDSRLQPGTVDPRRFRHNLAALADALKEDAPPKSLAFLLDIKRRKHLQTAFDRAFADQVTRGADQIHHGQLLKGVAQLRGCGRGLTPAGDDFIAGLLIGLHMLRRMHRRKLQPVIEVVFRVARGSNVFSNAFLSLARRGLLFGRLKDLLQALTAGRRPAVRTAAAALFTLGETSGADLATGLFLTLVSEVTRLASAEDF